MNIQKYTFIKQHTFANSIYSKKSDLIVFIINILVLLFKEQLWSRG